MWNKKKKKREDENMLRNGGLLLEKRISYFNGKYSNPIRTFSVEELQKANPNLFSGFDGSRWYKVCLEGRAIFVKKYEGYYPSNERVSNEIAVAAQVSGHKNALKLLGCCLETPKPTAVFEFPMNGNLYYQLTSNPTCLPWRIRLKIANEIASVITYLHTKFPRPIIHRDINLESIHLDQDFSAKLSGFMFCMTLPEGKTQVESRVIFGTNHYMAPELRLYGVYSEKSDVFGFGTLLLFLLMRVIKYHESITNEIEAKAAGGGEGVHHHQFQVVSELYIRNHTINEIVDPTILAEAKAAGGGEGVHHHHHQFQAISELILRCHKRNAEERPFMLDVAKQLKRIQRYYRPFFLHHSLPFYI